MLDPQEVSNLIEEKLNEIGKAWHDPYTFKLFSEIGEDNGRARISAAFYGAIRRSLRPCPETIRKGSLCFP